MATSRRFMRLVDKASEEFYEFVCGPCAADDKHIEAVKYCQECNGFLCSRCLKEHNRFPAMKTHKLQDPAAMRGQGPPLAKFVPTERCEIHHGNPIDIFCGNHDAVCCGTCVSVNHRSCFDITYILDAARGVTKSQDYRNIKDAIGKVQSELQKLKKTKQEYRSRRDKEKKDCLTKIGDFRKTINHHIDDLEKTAYDRVHAKHKEHEDRVNSDIKSLEKMLSVLDARIDQLKKADSNNEPQIFVYTKMGKQNQNDGEKLLQEMKALPKPEPLSFEINPALKDMIVSVKSFGDFQQADLGDQSYTASLRGHYDLKITGDLRDCDISGSCLLPDGTMLINDWGNDKLKRLDQSYKVTDSCDYPQYSGPYSVCTIGPGVAAVVLARTNQIQFVLLEKRMKLTTSFKVNQSCLGVAYINGELLVSCELPGQIHTYNMAGKRLRTFQTDAAAQQMFSYPWHIAVSTDNTLIHVSDRDNGVITLDLQGNKQSQFTDRDLKNAKCVYPGSNGQMFVCGHDTNNVFQISLGGQKLGVLLDKSDGVKKPGSLLYNNANSRLIVTLECNNNISVFDLSRK